MKKILIGVSDFKNMITGNGYYVDKTLFIKEIIDSGAQVTLFTRPRRFGKTLNLSMLRYFFDLQHPENKVLYDGLKIAEYQQIIDNFCCQFPVIFLTLKDVKFDNWEECYQQLVIVITDLFKAHQYLLESNHISSTDKKLFNKILNREAWSVDYQRSLSFLSELLYNHHKKPVIILIDEYDTPIHHGYDKYYDKIVSFMRNFLSSGLKDNSFLYKAVITGILRVSKESIFSGLNNIDVYSILNNYFENYFGFTEQEVIELLKYFGKYELFEQVKHWYNGYRIGNLTDIYNPWSVLNFISKPEQGFHSYWTQTSTNALIKHEIQKQEAEQIRFDIETLLQGGTVAKDIIENFVFSDLQTDKDLLWTLMLFSGYLTFTEKLWHSTYLLKIPNNEVKTVFQETVIDWIKNELRIQKSLLDKTLRALIQGQLDEFEQGFRRVMQDTFSYYDTQKFNEYVFHAYLLGLLAILGDYYEIKSNRESGEGRYDILLIPRQPDFKGIIIKIKRTDKQGDNESDQDFNQRIKNLLQQGLKQIERKQYYKELLNKGLKDNDIIKVVVVFAGKIPYVNKDSQSAQIKS